MVSQHLYTLFEHLNNPVIAIDPTRSVLFCNQAATELFNLTHKNPIGQPLHQLIKHPDLLLLFEEASYAQADIAFADESVFQGQVTHIEGIGSVLVMLDVTPQRQHEQHRTHFIANVSRDLRSPLTAILGYVELLEKVGSLTEQQHDFIGRIIFGVHSISALLSKALDLERIEGRLDSPHEYVSLIKMVEYALESLQRRIEEKCLLCNIFLDDSIPPIKGTPSRLKQMISHLLDNAIKFTPKGGEIRIDLYAESEFLVLVISDTGIGINQAELPYIFDRFYRGDTYPQDTGLGLSIVKTIVEQHHGRIWVESIPQKGSTFTVMLPAHS